MNPVDDFANQIGQVGQGETNVPGVGDVVKTDPATTVPSQQSTGESQGPPEQGQKKKINPKMIVGAVILALVVAVGAGGTIYFSTRTSDLATSQDTRSLACNPETYNECCGPGLSRRVTRTCSGGQASYQVGSCDQSDGACGSPSTGSQQTCGAGEQWQNGQCVCVNPGGCGGGGGHHLLAVAEAALVTVRLQIRVPGLHVTQTVMMLPAILAVLWVVTHVLMEQTLLDRHVVTMELR